MRLPGIAAAALSFLAAFPAAAQETRPDQSVHDRVVQLARGSERDRLAAVLFLEDSRSTDLVAWQALLGGHDDEAGKDGAHRARVFRALGRVGEPELKPLLKTGFDESSGPWTPDLKRAMGVATGLLPDPALIGQLEVRGAPMSFFAMGLAKVPPDTHLRSWAEDVPPNVDAETFEDPVEAALRWGAVIDPPPFGELAHRILTESAMSPLRVRAAIDYFARSKAKAPANLRSVLTGQLRASEPEVSGLAARALAKSEGAGDAEVAAIEAALASGGARVAQVDRVRALGGMKSGAAGRALVRAIAQARPDPAVLRTVMEVLKPVPWDAAGAEVRKAAADAVAAIVQPAEGETWPSEVRAAAVSALAAVDPAGFRAGLPAFRLAAPWQVRAAAAQALVQVREFDWVQRFLADPERRVRIAMLEALAEMPKLNVAGQQDKDFVTVLVLQRALTAVIPEPGRNDDFVIRTHDPVELSLLATLAREQPSLRVPGIELVGKVVSRIPDHEVEALQSVLDLAAAHRFHDVLRKYLESPEISLRKRAKDLLKKNGVEAMEAPPAAQHPEELAKLLDRCIERADGVLAKPIRSAVIETSRGPITIRLFAADAPATVENFLGLAKKSFYDGLLWHRVVPAFVAQAGCPRGDGWGGPGYTIRCEVNHRTYRRGSIGMALAGKDTGGSQFFICHRALPHLDGRYTLFGQVTDGMEVVDMLGQEDWIVRVREL